MISTGIVQNSVNLEILFGLNRIKILDNCISVNICENIAVWKNIYYTHLHCRRGKVTYLIKCIITCILFGETCKRFLCVFIIHGRTYRNTNTCIVLCFPV